ncbi:TetR/AcrR family transcriptional regulator [Nocardiopsis trehalosi]|uniref:TetR/AcrR family transcriptional regulator n=1 Tax=Nocardiopsis trehalosi TaxID=109329 RepID=UPI00082A8DEA|nr:TetR/AcrR family transcriptional regulator [Nocardiopsis trehalosi]
MPHRTPRASAAGSWQWSRTAETRRTLLAAAREVFTASGFAEAGVAAVVERAGSSVGSLYHHFGGKTELFLALWEEHQAEQERRAASAVSAARAAGTDDPRALFTAGARAFLDGAWEHRDLVRLFSDGDGPPGFERTRRARDRAWVRQNTALLGSGTSPAERATVAIVTTVIAEAAREVAVCPTPTEAAEVTTTTLRLIPHLLP